MKTLLLIIATSLLLLNNSFAQRGVVNKDTAQNKYTTKNELRVGFFNLFNSEFFLSYERLFDNNTSLVVNGGMILKQTSDEEKIGGEGELQYRLYLRHNYKKEPSLAFNGIYTGPYVFYKYLDKTNNSIYYDYDYNTNFGAKIYTKTNYNYSTIGAGVLFGMKFIIAHRISVDISLGGGLKYTDTHPDLTNYYYDIYSDAYTGIAPRGKITFGIRF